MGGAKGRPRDTGTERWATVTEVAETLGWSVSNVYRRIKANTIPHEQHVENERASYRIDRDWLKAETERRVAATPATTGQLAHEGEIRVAEILAAFGEHAEAIRAELETQNTEFLPLERDQLENQTRILGEIAGMKTGLDEFFRLVRGLDARLNEQERVEREFQQNNLELGRELRDLTQRNVELFEAMKADADAMKAQREEGGQAERRGFWRRLFGD